MHSQPKTRKTLNPTLVQARASEKDPMLEAKVAEARGEGWEGGGGCFHLLDDGSREFNEAYPNAVILSK